MTKIYLIRHVQAEGNLYRIMQGHWDGDVTALGRVQADALSKAFRGVHTDAAYSSDLYRAMFTARAAARYSGVSITPREDLREINMGSWEARYFGDIQHREPEMLNYFMTDPEKWHVEGSESYRHAGERCIAALCDIARSHPDGTVIVVSHGVTIRSALCILTGTPFTDKKALPICSNAAINTLIYDNGALKVREVNNIKHLEAENLLSWRDIPMLRTESFDPASDKEYYESCYADAWLSAHGDLHSFIAMPYYRSAISHYKEHHMALQRAFDGDIDAGLLDLDPLRGASEGCGWVSLLYLKPEYRHMGCGIQLLSRAYVFYRALGRRRLRLHCSSDNTDALSFYKKWGFKVISSEMSAESELLLLEKDLERFTDA